MLKFFNEQINFNWISCFVKCYNDNFLNVYFESINYVWCIINNNKYFKDYFEKINAYLNLY